MLRTPVRLIFLFLVCIAASGFISNRAFSQNKSAPDLTDPNHPVLYVVAYAHLDTEWRWEYPQTIGEFLPNTMHTNFDLFKKYPHYIFNFSGANRYRMMKEYYPADFATLTKYVKEGRWFPAGSSMEEGDVNSPSAEGIIRQILYGNNWFRHEFGVASAEYMLPDCFGFPASLPSILAHAGVKGFSTQKLTWGSAAPVGGPGSIENTPRGTPFNVGIWEGTDGKSIIAALNPGGYSESITEDISKSPVNMPKAGSRPSVDWPARVEQNGKVGGLFTDYHYYGTGDIGGAPTEGSVALVESMVKNNSKITAYPPLSSLNFTALMNLAKSPRKAAELEIVSSKADQMFLDIKPNETSRLPHYKGDLELTNHSAGSLTSEAYQKRWVRKNELLADAAERASVAANWLDARPYPKTRLNNAWTLAMGAHFHDLMAGTATPKAYEFAWNDDVIAMNQFATVLSSATEGVASGLNTETKGTPIVVYNPLNIEREDVVEAKVNFPGGLPKAVRVFGPDGKEVTAQLEGDKVLFLARTPSVSYTVYDIRPSDSVNSTSILKVTDTSLENARYRVRIDGNGDVASIYDKTLNKELLALPARLALQTEKPRDWPAWNMDWADQKEPPRAFVGGPVKMRVVENGPVRVAIEVKRKTEGSEFIQTIRLSTGDAGNRVEFGNVIDWKTGSAALKATFPLTAANSMATYNWDIGTIQRGNNDEKKFEVPSHQWFDLTDKSGSYGVTILSDCKNGSDKPDDNTLRLTLLYTPGLGTGNGRSYSDQTSQDWGHHEFIYGLTSHAGDWRREKSDWQGQRLNQPLIAFQSDSHTGRLGKSFSLLSLNNDRVRVLALKKAEESDEIILRLVELDGKTQQNVKVSFPASVSSAREVNGQEQPVGKAEIRNGALVTGLEPYQPKTFAIKLQGPAFRLGSPHWQDVSLHYDRTVSSRDKSRSSGGFDGAGNSLPSEMLPREIAYNGIGFRLAADGSLPDAVTANGQNIALPQGHYKRVYLLAASTDGDQKATFKVGENSTELTIQNWRGYIGQWDNRLWNQHKEVIPMRPGAPEPPPGTPPRMRNVLDFTGLVPGYIKRSPVAWFASHYHTADGANVPYSYSYLFAYAIDMPAGATTLTLPDNDKIRILAVTVSYDSEQVQPAQPLYDTLEREGQ